MARHRNPIPTYRQKVINGTPRAVVTVYTSKGQRKEILLPGVFNSEESRQGYECILIELRTNGGTKPAKDASSRALAVNEVVLRYLTEHAATYYVDPITKEPTTEQSGIREAVRPLLRLYGHLPINEFDSLCLQAVQDAMATGLTLTDKERASKLNHKRPIGLARTTINRHIDRIKRIMRWGCVKKIVPADNLVNIEAVEGLRQGRSIARETEIVKPIDPAFVEMTLPYMPETPADMVRVMLLSGCRVGELCRLKGCELDRTSPVWIYKPLRHKTATRGHIRTITFGPKAQLILRKYLKADPNAYLFSPTEQDEHIREAKREARKSKVQPSQLDRSKPNPKRKPGECYNAHAVNHAIRRACAAADVERWHTHRLRHTAALNILREFGPEGARSALGHKTLNLTLLYAGIDLERAKDVASKIG
jgi:integrase